MLRSAKLHIKQLNRVFHDLVHNSPQIQHKLDLFAAGLEPNWSTGFTLADRVKSLEEYHSRWEDIDIDMYQTAVKPPSVGSQTIVGGICASIPKGDEIKFCTLPSSFRAIVSKSHTIPFDPEVIDFAFNPQADVIVFSVLATDNIL